MPDPHLESRLRGHVQRLAGEIGPRGLFRPEALTAAENYIRDTWEQMGHAVTREPVAAANGLSHNLIVERPGSVNGNLWLVGAHYDTVATTPGADDNASAVACLLEIARFFSPAPRSSPPSRGRPCDTLRLVAFTNEEMPHFSGRSHGAMVHAAGCRQRRERIRMMLSLEMLGYYTDDPNSQRYPAGLGALYPQQGNFIAMVGTLRGLFTLRRLVAGFRDTVDFPCQYLASPVWLPAISRSDHFAFWLHRYPAMMITDTADFRNPHYHTPADTPDTLNYTALAQVTQGLCGTLSRNAGEYRMG
ncbi:MAG: M28 family peptidase [Nitrospirota bacterium]|nr:M28 family peptidase [Nitrospirota bacterium]